MHKTHNLSPYTYIHIYESHMAMGEEFLYHKRLQTKFRQKIFKTNLRNNLRKPLTKPKL